MHAFSLSEHKFEQVCLTYGFPDADYGPGLINCPYYVSTWDCTRNSLYECNEVFECVKCSFIEALVENLFDDFRQTFADLSRTGTILELQSGLSTFEIVRNT